MRTRSNGSWLQCSPCCADPARCSYRWHGSLLCCISGCWRIHSERSGRATRCGRSGTRQAHFRDAHHVEGCASCRTRLTPQAGRCPLLTGANERTVKNWLSGQYGPCGAHLIVLIQHSDEVLNAVLSMARRHDLVVAQKLVDLEQRLLELMSTVKELRSRSLRM
jgi:hypothetical protein